MYRLGFILFTCLLTGCGSSLASTEADDLQAWQGTRKLVSCIANGESQIADMRWIVNGDHYTISLHRRSDVTPYTFKLDPQLKRVNVFHHETPVGTYGGRLKGIYEIEGNSMKVCYDLKGQRCPTSFDASRGSTSAVSV
jgi:uncharacterized protein (TIGR03067 family)